MLLVRQPDGMRQVAFAQAIASLPGAEAQGDGPQLVARRDRRYVGFD
ncbi:hypothetical protein QFZ96_005786 [Paraburkholderia youngii]